MNTNSISQTLQEKETISAIKRLYIFNPEHDFALAVGRKTYTPPAEILKIKRLQSLLPAIYADNGDFILVPQDLEDNEIEDLPNSDLISQKNINLVRPKELSRVISSVFKIIPWGWDYFIKRSLKEFGVPEDLLLSDDKIEEIRRLSHRSTSLNFREFLSEILKIPLIKPGKELFSVEEVKNFLEIHPYSFFKAPWSSSGRGIVVSDHISRKGLLEWSHGIIRRQGSVIAEPTWEKQIDFATEWVLENGEIVFKGYSVFNTSSRGKYHGNLNDSQTNLLKLITSVAQGFNDSYIEAQRLAIHKFISPFYEGPLGIDMLADADGNINPCVEINLRLTMGYILLDLQKKD